MTLKLSADQVTAQGPVTLTATASDPDGTIARVEFYDGDALLGKVEAAPYKFVWNNAAPGNHLLTARAIDSQGAAGESSPRFLTVSPAKPGSGSTKMEIKALAKDSVRLTVRSAPGDYIISMSGNLVEWSDIYPITIDASGVGTLDDSGGPMNFTTLFYRVRRAE